MIQPALPAERQSSLLLLLCKVKRAEKYRASFHGGDDLVISRVKSNIAAGRPAPISVWQWRL